MQCHGDEARPPRETMEGGGLKVERVAARTDVECHRPLLAREVFPQTSRGLDATAAWGAHTAAHRARAAPQAPPSDSMLASAGLPRVRRRARNSPSLPAYLPTVR